MPKRPISYTNRDFKNIKNDLVNYAKRYYPSTYKDFNEASFGALMLDMVAYIGDQLSFYADYQANESYLDSALEYQNIIRLSKQMGFKMPGAASSTGAATFYILVPASTTGGPDLDYFPILKRGALLSSDGGNVYTLNENVNFSNTSNEITVARVDSSTGSPTWYAVKAFGQILSGQELETSLIVEDYQRFFKAEIDAENVSEILSVTDSQGNEYYEVDFLSQDTVISQVPNYGDEKETVPYVLKSKSVPRRFTTEYDAIGNVSIQFGYGSSENLTSDLISDPADVVLDVVGRTHTTDVTFDPTNLITSDKFGVVPENTTLIIKYRSNTQENANAKSGAVNSVVNPDLVFKERSSLNRNTMTEIIQSLETSNDSPITGDTSVLLPEEIRERAYSAYASQNRAVTKTDYISLCYRLPSKFGRIRRVNIIRDSDSNKRNLNLYVLSEDSEGDLSIANTTLKTNLKNWLNSYRMMNDTLDIMDGKIINYGVNFEVIVDATANKYEVLSDCVDKIKDSVINIKKNFGDPIYITDFYKALNSIPGVVDTTTVEIESKSGGVYSSSYHNMDSNLSDDGRYIKIPANAVAELLFPDENIQGVIR
jgi:hypothetical protein|tara:strand:- start:547 stop:2337 length:1791 start_codon:yes stop_codon:yes gene_type:complete